jgi:hypothetical protein
MIQTLLLSISFAVRVLRSVHFSQHVYQILKPATTFSDCVIKSGKRLHGPASEAVVMIWATDDYENIEVH